ncbi:hypothetical protein [Maribacter arenosus]|uniref:Uncharacterized protein n=1 Tax=Maribacter arenosus TaxID=1854708 RepID=A0ABR7VE74_9FLAO|nr:hypothetical protein [Maribacter arenosus]MBD0851921.1 hypothetical protein [Maribacter arenosus]
MLKKVIRTIFVFSSIGLTISIVVHVLTIFGVIVQDYFSGVWLLQAFGIGITGITIILSRTHEYQAKKTTDEKTLGSWDTIFDGIPKSYIGLLIFSAVYAFFNIIISLNYFEGSASLENGQYVLTDHGRIIRALTKSEYNSYRISDLRTFSSGWVALYGLAFLMSNPLARFWNKY